ncbi:MAG: GTP-binding protein [Saprospiraceae bacterium]|uniref:sulfate adenylyltransferase n=1 Tax=Candidatus Opimibacter skivensis TaxID=2982028 RepID=A0A9D7SUD3_9BACT|nr:GTP-binding protein [Candidatus Opimibacter skivensis]
MTQRSHKQSNSSTELLRFTTAGSVDDGKSTLIGRLLYDSKSIFQDQYDAIEEVSKRRGEEGINLALLTDGLKAEREQGITIDVAYRYFSTPKRKFIIADTPGHIQYTRNMVTGASTANVALVLIDARQGVLEQTRRHAIIASLLQIPHLVICINKMDLVDYSQEVYDRIHDEFEAFASKLDVHDVNFIPISALRGDNIVDRSQHMPWYEGSTLLYYLENVHIASDYNFIDCRFPVQYVIRPYNDEFHDYRGYAGRIAGGILKKGDDVMLLPSGFTTRISKIEMFKEEIEEAFPPMSVVVHIEDDFDLSRGDMIVRANNMPRQEQDIDLMICWFHEKPLEERGKYVLRHTTKESRCIIKEVRYRMDVNTLHRDMTDKKIKMNDIARITIRSTLPLFVDAYQKNRITGSIILIDEGTNETVAAGMII